ncbi:Uncharacterised protein [Mycobacterium tuberculosis]|uniref:Uncharacterized protein n=1 Tax=Mycobacterium tuberculosis TaxID=1773 RepID=A0A916PC19_MYCTX|nr:Uncharacterised protein [Mycobacterium tuberculosis]COW84340.1 Uncharacterised protein [Mycobacterium tuberculosis]COY81349.1 Uncharacterised protein [Mycobacterium tuberculosis]
MQLRFTQGEPVGVAVDSLVRCGTEQRENRLEGLLHHSSLLDRIDAHHVGVRRQRAGAGAEHDPPTGQVIQQHPTVGHH